MSDDAYARWLADVLEEYQAPAFYHRAIEGMYPQSELSIEASFKELPQSLIINGLWEVPAKITINNHPYRYVKTVPAAMHGISIEVAKVE